MTPSFGTRLRLQRERQQISLAEIAERTKIRQPLLESLERGDVRDWPSGIFRRSYLRAYARAIGLDPETTVREFLALYPDPAEHANDLLAVAEAATRSEPLGRRVRARLQELFDTARDAVAAWERQLAPNRVPTQGSWSGHTAGHTASDFAPPHESDAKDFRPEPHGSSAADPEDTAEAVLLPLVTIDSSALEDYFPSEAEHPGLVRHYERQSAPSVEDPVRGVAAESANSPAAADARDVPVDSPDALPTDAVDVERTAALDAPPPDAAANVTAPFGRAFETNTPKDVVAAAECERTAALDAPPPDAAANVAAPFGRAFERDTPKDVVAAAEFDTPAEVAVDLSGLAHLCSRIATARTAADVADLMPEIARMVGAETVIYWMWDPRARVLWPSISHGYEPERLRRMPRIRADRDHALAASFREHETRVVDSIDGTGVLVVPVLTPISCAGVIVLEFRDGGERLETVQALSRIIASQLAALTYVPPLAQSMTA